MIYHEGRRLVALNLRSPDRVTSVIPTAKLLYSDGRPFVVLPHRPDEVKVLRELGIKVDSPLLKYYDWPIRQGRVPMAHQKVTAEFLTSNYRAYCLDDLGTGKSTSALWAFDYLRSEGVVKKMLVVAPFSTLTDTWASAVFCDFPHLRAVVVHGSRSVRVKLLEEEADVYIINHDGLKVVKNELLAHDFDCVAIDELSQVARNQQTGRWELLREIIRGRKIVWGLTGTPMPNAPTDVYAQVKLLTPERVPMSFTTFKNKVMIQITEYIWEARDNALDTAYATMQPAIRHNRDEVIDLPPVMYETLECKFTAEQARLYKEMMKELQTESEQGVITAVNQAVKLGKLIQICCGHVRGDDATQTITPPQSRLDALEHIIDGAAGKVIVFVPYKGSLHMVADHLSKKYNVEKIYGEVSKTERSRIFSSFQRSKDLQVIVAQPASMSHGLTLTEANVIVWFAPVTSADTYTQANGRITRPGQRHEQFIIHLQGSPVEQRMYEKLKDKSNLQGLLLDMFQTGA